jgi:hypothetical protein
VVIELLPLRPAGTLYEKRRNGTPMRRRLASTGLAEDGLR